MATVNECPSPLASSPADLPSSPLAVSGFAYTPSPPCPIPKDIPTPTIVIPPQQPLADEVVVCLNALMAVLEKQEVALFSVSIGDVLPKVQPFVQSAKRTNRNAKDLVINLLARMNGSEPPSPTSSLEEDLTPPAGDTRYNRKYSLPAFPNHRRLSASTSAVSSSSSPTCTTDAMSDSFSHDERSDSCYSISESLPLRVCASTSVIDHQSSSPTLSSSPSSAHGEFFVMSPPPEQSLKNDYTKLTRKMTDTKLAASAEEVILPKRTRKLSFPFFHKPLSQPTTPTLGTSPTITSLTATLSSSPSSNPALPSFPTLSDEEREPTPAPIRRTPSLSSALAFHTQRKKGDKEKEKAEKEKEKPKEMYATIHEQSKALYLKKLEAIQARAAEGPEPFAQPASKIPMQQDEVMT